MAYSAYDRLLMGSPLRRRGIGKVTVAVLLLLLGFAALTQLSLFAGMRPDVESVFLRALVLSTLLSLVPIAVLRFSRSTRTRKPVADGGGVPVGRVHRYRPRFAL
jgi:hypothetical protein